MYRGISIDMQIKKIYAIDLCDLLFLMFRNVFNPFFLVHVRGFCLMCFAFALCYYVG